MNGIVQPPNVLYGAGPKPLVYSLDTQRQWAKAIRTEAVRPLSAWERNFMDSIAEKLERGWPLTGKQVNALERIYAEKTP